MSDSLEEIKIGVNADGAASGIDTAIDALRKLAEAAAETRAAGGDVTSHVARGRAIAESAGRQVAGLSGQIDPRAISQITRQLVANLTQLDRSLADAYRNTLRTARVQRGQEFNRTGEPTDFGTGRQYTSLREFVQGETALRQSNAKGSNALATSSRYQTANAEAETANRLNSAAKSRALANSDYPQASAQAATALKRLAAAELEAQNNTTDYAEATIAVATQRKRAAGLEAEIAATDQDYLTAVSISTAALKERAAAEAEAATSQRSVLADTRTQLAKRRGSAAVTAGVLGGITSEDINSAASNTATQSRIKALTQLAELEQRDVAVEAQLTVAKQDYQKRLQEAIAAIRPETAAGASGGGGGGASIFQRLLARSSPGGNDPSTFPTLGQFAGRHAVNTLGYAVPGIAIGVGLEELRASVQEAEKAQLSFRELQAQVQALGQGDQFSTFKQSIEGIANETGLAVSEVAQLGIAMEGVYGNTTQATDAVKNISVATVAMGLTLGEAEKDVIAITQSFSGLQNAGPSAITTISNEALHLEDITGVNSKDILAGTADLGPVANQVGLNYNQTASLIAGTAQVSGQSAADVATNLGRIIPQFSQNLPQISEYYNQLPQLAGSKNAFSGDVTNGNISQAFEQFLSDFKKLPSQAQSALAESLGDVRYAPTLIAAGESQQTKLSNRPAAPDRTAQQFALQQQTLSIAFERLRQDVVNVGVNILDSGVGTGLVDIARVLGTAVTWIGNLNKATGGLVSDLAVFGGALLAFKGVSSVVGLFRAGPISAATTSIVELGAAAKVSADALLTAAGEETVGGAVGGGASVGLLGGAGLLGRLGTPSSGTGLFADASLGLGAAAGVGVAGYVGYKAGTDLLNISKQSGTTGHVVKDALTPVTAPATALGHLFSSSGSDGVNGSSTKYAKQQEDYVNNQIKPRVEALTKLGTLTPQQEQALQALYGGANTVAGYNQLLQAYNSIVFPDATGKNGTAAKANVTQVNRSLGAKPPPPAKALPNTSAIPGVISSSQVTTPEEFQQLYESGTGSNSLQAYQQSLQGEIKVLKGEASGKNGSPDAYAEIPQYLQELAQLQDQLAQSTQQFTQELQVQGSPAGDVNIINSTTTLLKNVKSPENQLSAISSFFSAINTQTQDLANVAQTGAAKNAALGRTVAIPVAVQAILKQYGINQSSVTGYVSPTEKYQNLSTDVSANQALAVANANEDPLAVARANQAAAAQNLQNVLASGESKTSDDYKNAAAALKTANEQIFDAQNAVSQAQLGYLAQLFSNTPIQGAEYAIQQAQAVLAGAHGPAAIAAAKQQIVQAQESYNTDVIAYSDALASVSEATSNVQGDPVAVALKTYQQALQDAATRASQDKALGLNPQNDTTYKNDIATALNDQASYLDTFTSTLTSIGESQLTLGQITATQYIARLEGALQTVKGNQKDTLAIETEIRQVQNSAGGALNFDLPTTLVPSTLYQARSLEQNGVINAGTNSAPVTVNINVNGGSAAEVNSAVSKLTAAVGGPQRTGTNPPLLNG